ncbi:MAG: hypothetical protein H7838_02540 [Magnetococcus sp. DMHC-8]
MKSRGLWCGCVVVIALLPSVGQATGQEQTVCPALGTDVPVEVRFNQAQPYVDDQHSRSWIQEQARALNHPIGLTVSRLSHTLTAHFLTRRITGRNQCVYLKSLSLVLEYPNTTVYVDNAYPPGSCEYQAIYQHEMEHVRILNTHQEKFLPSWRARLQTLAHKTRPLLSENSQQAQQEILHALDRAVRKEIEQLDKIQKAAQAAIDTPRNYTKVRASCRQW